jgi:endonuclease YncB( thermonuclease family)
MYTFVYRRKRYVWCVLFVLALVLLAQSSVRAAPKIGDDFGATSGASDRSSALPAGAVPARVTDIVDGDTIRVQINGVERSVRYILINTPETDEPLGAEATLANRRLVAGKTVYLLKDVNDTDRYNRLLRYVFLADGTHVNAELVRQGYAQLSTYPPDISRQAEIRAAQQEAVAAGRGLWASSSPSVGSGTLSIAAVDNREEYVDVRNGGQEPVRLEGWVLRSERGRQECALSGELGAGATLRVWAMKGPGGVQCGFASPIWNNNMSDPAVLLAPGGSEVARWE